MKAKVGSCWGLGVALARSCSAICAVATDEAAVVGAIMMLVYLVWICGSSLPVEELGWVFGSSGVLLGATFEGARRGKVETNRSLRLGRVIDLGTWECTALVVYVMQYPKFLEQCLSIRYISTVDIWTPLSTTLRYLNLST